MRRHNSIVSNAERLLARAERVEESDEKIIKEIGKQPSMRIISSFDEDSYKDQINRTRRVLAKSQENARLKQTALEEEVEVLKRKLSRQAALEEEVEVLKRKLTRQTALEEEVEVLKRKLSRQTALEKEVEVLKRKLSRQGSNKRLNSYRAIVEDVVDANTPHRFVRPLVLAWLVCNSVVFLGSGAALFVCGERRGIISTLCARRNYR